MAEVDDFKDAVELFKKLESFNSRSEGVDCADINKALCLRDLLDSVKSC